MLATLSWTDAGTQAAIAGPVSAVVCWFLIGRLARRIDRMEDGRDAFRKDLLRFEVNLQNHQNEDCRRLDSLGEQIGGVGDTVIRIDESTKTIKEKLTKDGDTIHERITQHTERTNRQLQTLSSGVTELSKQVAVLASKSPPPAPPTTPPKKPRTRKK